MMSSNGCATLAAVAFMRPAASCLVAASLPPHPPFSMGLGALGHHTSVSPPSCFAAFPLHQPLSLGLDQLYCERDWWSSPWAPWAPWAGWFLGLLLHHPSVCPGPCQALCSVTKARWAPFPPLPCGHISLEWEGWLPLTSELPQRPVTDPQPSIPTLLWDSVSFILYTCDFVQL